MPNEINSKEEGTAKGRDILAFLKMLIMCIIMFSIIRAFLFSNFVVSGESMNPNFNNGDQLLVTKLTYKVVQPKRFDVVVFHAIDNKDFIKRVIGLPGDKIEYKNNSLYVNGNIVKEVYLDKETTDFSLLSNLGKEIVPKDHVFVLGDNRTNSMDSRYKEVGFVPVKNIVGKVSIRYYPFHKVDFGVAGNKKLN